MKTVGARRVKLNKLHTEGPQTLVATVKNLVARATWRDTTTQKLVARAIWRPRFVRPWLGV